MLWDWQTIAVWLIILAALVYVGRRGWGRVRSFRANGKTQAACASGCGSCGTEKAAAARTPATQVLVQLNRSNSTARQTH
ncbi:MAG: FeoB-associated Cys-rich membrane protein [Pyrinomonadaceae bacterium]